MFLDPGRGLSCGWRRGAAAYRRHMVKRNLKKAGKWLLAGVLCGALTVVCFQVERSSGGRYALTAGSGLIAILCFAAAVCSLMGKMNDGNGMMTVEEIFKMNSGGYVAAGHVRGVFYSGQKVLLQGQDGKKTKTRIRGIEIGGRKAGAAADTPAALYLKDIEPDCIRRGDVIRNRE